jgi:phosphate transport system substrate-binding protein
MAYFGYAYYASNKDKLKLVAVDGGNGPVKPSVETVRDGSYTPLSRPIFIYVNRDLLQRPAGRAFVTYYVENAGKLAEDALYVAPDEATAEENERRLTEALSGVADSALDSNS